MRPGEWASWIIEICFSAVIAVCEFMHQSYLIATIDKSLCGRDC